MAEKTLIDQCVVWCRAKGLKPIKPFEPPVLRMAVAEFEGGFRDLSRLQRCLVAGLADK